MSFKNTLLRTALAAGASVVLAGVAHAQKTEAGTSVGNVFALDYTVGGVQQGRITNDPSDDLNSGYSGPTIVDNGDGVTAFTVDRLVDFTITELNSPLDTPPNATQVSGPTGASAAARELMFSITNDGNDHSAYSFQIEEVSTPSGGVDEFLSTNRTIRFYRATYDLDGVAGDASGCEAEQNEVITVTPIVPEGTAPSTSAPFVVSGGQLTCDLAPGETAYIFIGADMPEVDVSSDPLTENDEDNIILLAQARNPQLWTREAMGTGATGPGAVTQEDTDGNSLEGAAEVVLAEGSGPATGDVASDGVFSAAANWLIIDPDLTATKEVALLDQTASAAACATLVAPASPTSDYFIPGSCVEYTITVTNTGDADGSDAEGIALTDPLPADMLYVSHTLGGDFSGGTVEVDTTLAGTTDCVAGTDAGCVVKVTGATLASSGSGDTVGTLVIRAYLP